MAYKDFLLPQTRATPLLLLTIITMGLDTADTQDDSESSYGTGEMIRDGLETKTQSPHAFFMFCLDMKEMSEGGNAGGLRAIYNPSLTDADFRTVLDSIGGDEILKHAAQPGIAHFYDEILARFKTRKRDSDYYETVNELVNMAYGGNPSNLRRGYPGWTNGDFKKLLIEMGQKESLEYQE